MPVGMRQKPLDSPRETRRHVKRSAELKTLEILLAFPAPKNVTRRKVGIK